MPNPLLALVDGGVFDDTPAASRADALVITLDDVGQRCERLAAYAEATRPVIVYRFSLPNGARIQALGGGQPRDAGAQLEMIVGLTGGGLAKGQGELAVRIPKRARDQFEALAAPLIAAYLVALDLGAN